MISGIELLETDLCVYENFICDSRGTMNQWWRKWERENLSCITIENKISLIP